MIGQREGLVIVRQRINGLVIVGQREKDWL